MDKDHPRQAQSALLQAIVSDVAHSHAIIQPSEKWPHCNELVVDITAELGQPGLQFISSFDLKRQEAEIVYESRFRKYELMDHARGTLPGMRYDYDDAMNSAYDALPYSRGIGLSVLFNREHSKQEVADMRAHIIGIFGKVGVSLERENRRLRDNFNNNAMVFPDNKKTLYTFLADECDWNRKAAPAVVDLDRQGRTASGQPARQYLNFLTY